jgi:hypothetical protein
MIAGHRVVEGFWLGQWMRERSVVANLRLLREIGLLIREGVLATELGHLYPLDQFTAATKAAETVGKSGKVLFQLR